jgi:uncharacterized membrane protein
VVELRALVLAVSLIPFTTEWIAESRLAAAPVASYAAVFVLVNVTYLALCWEAVDRPAGEAASKRVRRRLAARVRRLRISRVVLRAQMNWV